MIALLLAVGGTCGSGTGMRFVNDHHFWTLLYEYVAPRIRLDKVNADDLIWVVVIYACVTLDLTI